MAGGWGCTCTHQIQYRTARLPQPRLELAEKSHEQTYWGRNCSFLVLVLTVGGMAFIPERLLMMMMMMMMMMTARLARVMMTARLARVMVTARLARVGAISNVWVLF